MISVTSMPDRAVRARASVRLAILALVVVCGGAAVHGALSRSRTPVHRTAHLAFSVTVAPDAVAPGSRTSIVIDVSPRQGMHVYAPGTSYRPLTIAVDSEPSIRVHEAVYPPPTPHVFTPLNEKVLVYQAPFRVVRDITVVGIEGTRAAMPARARSVTLTRWSLLSWQRIASASVSLVNTGSTQRGTFLWFRLRRAVIRGHLEYQACDATVCYLPESVPFERIIRIIDDGAGEVPPQTGK